MLQVTIPDAIVEAGGSPPTAGTSSQGATASDSAALSRLFLEEWQDQGCPGKPPPAGKRQLAPDRKTVVATHSLYNRTAGGDAVSAARASAGGEQAVVEGGGVVVESPTSAKKQRKLSAAEMYVVGSRRGCRRTECTRFMVSPPVYFAFRITVIQSYNHTTVCSGAVQTGIYF